MRRTTKAAVALVVLGGLGVSVGIGSYLGTEAMKRRVSAVMVDRMAVSVGSGGTGAAAGGTAIPTVVPTGGGITVVLTDPHGQGAAQVDVTPLPAGGTQVTVHAAHLAPGLHAIHVHAGGTCDAAATKVFDPHGRGAEFPTLLAGPDGQAQEQFTDADFTVADLFGPAGTEVVLHAGNSNNPGARIACGVISPAHPAP
jgi:Cu/Zn superoxide dismutase